MCIRDRHSGARVECFVCKDIKCALTMVIGEEGGFVLSVPQKRNIELNGAHCKGVRNVSSRRVGATTPPTTSCSHRAMQLDILTPQAATRDTSTNGES